MKQAKKVFTRMCLNNWGGISHKILEFNEYVNLFSGMSGSGKSTVMDAIQVILYGSLSSNFLNKAADDAKNKRSVISYLRGEQKDGSANRDNQDFCSTIVLEIEDTGMHSTVCVGAWFEVRKNENDIKKYHYFSHSGKMPEGGYVNAEGLPYSSKDLQRLVEERRNSRDNRGRGEVNKIYSSNESYLTNLNDVILGYIDGSRFRTMEKSAIALKMTNGTGQFIRDYMFTKSEGDIIEKLSEQLGAYRDIKERIDDVKKRIDLLTAIRDNGIKLYTSKADLELTQNKIKCIEICDAKAKIEAWESDRKNVEDELKELKVKEAELDANKKVVEDELVEVKASIKASDLGSKKQRLEDLERQAQLLAGNSNMWRDICRELRRWNEDEVAADYISNSLLEDVEKFCSGKITAKMCESIKEKISEEKKEIEELLDDARNNKNEVTKQLNEKRQLVDDIKNNRKTYSEHIRQARTMLETKLTNLYGKKVKVYVFADLFDVTNDKWRNAIEGRMGSLKLSLVTEPEFAHNAAEAFRTLKQFEDVHLINTEAIVKLDSNVLENSLYEEVKASEAFANSCLKHYLGRIIKCESVSELEKVRDGVTPDCYSYSNFIFRHLRKRDYTTGACIGTSVSKAKLNEYMAEIEKLEKRQSRYINEEESFKGVIKLESLEHYSADNLVAFAKAQDELEDVVSKRDNLQIEIARLSEGEFKQLEEKKMELESKINLIDVAYKANNTLIIDKSKLQAEYDTKVKDKKAELDNLTLGYIGNADMENEVAKHIDNSGVQSYKNELVRNRVMLTNNIETQETDLNTSRNEYIHAYPTCGFTGAEKSNDVYITLLNDYMENYEPQYQQEFDKQCNTVYRTLRENIIAKIHNDIKAAMRHKNEINRMLRDTNFSDSTYQIKIEAAKNEDGQFFDMLMASELDTKNPSLDDLDGQLSFGEDLFYQKYEHKISLLTDKFMPPKSDDENTVAQRRKEMEKYADYRTYLHFNMFEQVTDENGNIIRENYVDDMAGRDSGGEGQNPKYVALLAGFAMLYMDQTNRDSKIKLVLLDEAFSKMDQKRSEVCLKYARKLDLQLIVCVPDERLASLIRNVDCVYGFRRNKNKISMMHIDKGNYLDMING